MYFSRLFVTWFSMHGVQKHAARQSGKEAIKGLASSGLAERRLFAVQFSTARSRLATNSPVFCIMELMKVRDIIKRIEADGWTLDRQKGSHRQYVHPVKKGTVTVPGQLGEDIAISTEKSIWRRAQLETK
jgi:predicted RNA binding protein YcfA (HicA-like mRNA interferase family)